MGPVDDMEQPMSGTAVTYPTLRQNLESASNCFADKEFQASFWANPTRVTPHGRWDLTEAFEFVVDDDVGGGNLRGLLGEVLMDEHEPNYFRT